MKRTAKRLAIVFALVCVLAVSAIAADFTHCAEALNSLGLFQGTDKGYELDRAPTRAEASAMLVRLLGQEEAALALTTYTAPYTDVLDWAKPYVQYLYNNGLTKGMSETTFGSSQPCTAQMYTTFLLRSLGYMESSGDFTYAEAMAFGKEKKVVDGINCNEKTFLRDHVAAMSYTALATQTAHGAENLLGQLMKSGAVADDKGFDVQFATYSAYTKAIASANVSMTKSRVQMDMSIAAKLAGIDFLTGTFTTEIVMDMNMDKLDSSRLAMTSQLDAKLNPALFPSDKPISETIEMYYTQGNLYTKSSTEKVKDAISFESMRSQLGDVAMSTSAEPICIISKISAQNDVYTISYAPAGFSALMNSLAPAIGTISGVEMPTLDVNKLDAMVTLQGGKLTNQTMNIDVSMTLRGQKLDMIVDVTLRNVGGVVSVSLPTDLSTYVAATTPAA